MAEKNNNWGGKREGSGRKKSEVASTTTSFKLNDNLQEKLPKKIMDKDGNLITFNRSEYFNKAIRAQMIKDGYLEPSK